MEIPVSLSADSEIKSITVTAEDGTTTQTYTIQFKYIKYYVVQTEDFTISNPDGSANEWILDNTVLNYYGTGYMQAPASVTVYDGSIADSIDFTSTGTYYYWVRYNVPNISSDKSCFLFVDGSEVIRLEDWTNQDQWLWINHSNRYSSLSSIDFDIATLGKHEISIVNRQPNIMVDMVIITNDADFNPDNDNFWVPTSADATLSDLSISGYEISPTFDKDVTDYSVLLPEGVGTVDITATPTQAGAGVSGDGTVTVTGSGQMMDVVVTSEDGMRTKTYSIEVIIATKIVFQAEYYSALRSGVNAEDWTGSADFGGYHASGFMVAPAIDAALSDMATAQTDATGISYDLDIADIGTYYVWAYLSAPDYSSDSYWYGYDGSIVNSNSRVQLWPDAADTWIWKKGSETLLFETTGVHSFDIYEREQNMRLDMFVLTNDPNYDPTADTSLDIETVGKKLEDNEITAYPNPVDDVINIIGLEANSSLRIYSITGALVKSMEVSQSSITINVTDLNKGIYILELEHSGT